MQLRGLAIIATFLKADSFLSTNQQGQNTEGVTPKYTTNNRFQPLYLDNLSEPIPETLKHLNPTYKVIHNSL